MCVHGKYLSNAFQDEHMQHVVGPADILLKKKTAMMMFIGAVAQCLLGRQTLCCSNYARGRWYGIPSIPLCQCEPNLMMLLRKMHHLAVADGVLQWLLNLPANVMLLKCLNQKIF